jgi:hypothetical protein
LPGDWQIDWEIETRLKSNAICSNPIIGPLKNKVVILKVNVSGPDLMSIGDGVMVRGSFLLRANVPWGSI